VEFVDERENMLFKKNLLRLVNDGGSEALDVRIDDIPLRRQNVRFPYVAGSIRGNGGNEKFEPRVDRQYGPAVRPLLVTALMDEWNSFNSLGMAELLVPVTVRYTNFSRTFDYTTTCTLAFQAIDESLRRLADNRKPAVIFRDFRHEKMPRKP
jgi:hypothetical protein